MKDLNSYTADYINEGGAAGDKPMQKHIAVTEDEQAGRVVAVIAYTNDSDTLERLQRALSEHFDAEADLAQSPLDFGGLWHGNEVQTDVTLNASDDDQPHTTGITLQQTWLY